MDLRRSGWTRVCTDQEKADKLNNFFQSVFTGEDTTNMSSALLCEVGLRLEDVEIIGR